MGWTAGIRQGQGVPPRSGHSTECRSIRRWGRDSSRDYSEPSHVRWLYQMGRAISYEIARCSSMQALRSWTSPSPMLSTQLSHLRYREEFSNGASTRPPLRCSTKAGPASIRRWLLHLTPPSVQPYSTCYPRAQHAKPGTAIHMPFTMVEAGPDRSMPAPVPPSNDQRDPEEPQIRRVA